MNETIKYGAITALGLIVLFGICEMERRRIEIDAECPVRYLAQDSEGLVYKVWVPSYMWGQRCEYSTGDVVLIEKHDGIIVCHEAETYRRHNPSNGVISVTLFKGISND